MWAGIGSLFGALRAFFHLIRTMKHLLKLVTTLNKSNMATDAQVVRVRTIAGTQENLTAVRLASNALACAALPWTVDVATWGDSDTPNECDMHNVGKYRIPVRCTAGLLSLDSDDEALSKAGRDFGREQILRVLIIFVTATLFTTWYRIPVRCTAGLLSLDSEDEAPSIAG
jgi:hypothetical protein